MSLPIRVNSYSSHKENERYTEFELDGNGVPRIKKIDRDLCCIKSTQNIVCLQLSVQFLRNQKFVV
jgi:hypothetical protein